MARWESNAPERLERAALELFAEQGYDTTSVTEIASRAGLAKSSFFRHFADKREVLFGGQDILIELLTDGVRQAPPEATPVDVVAAALRAVAVVFTPGRHQVAPQRRAVISAHSELQERNLLKRARLSSAIEVALRARGIDRTEAYLLAEFAMLAFGLAFERWSALPQATPFGPVAEAALAELCSSAATLGSPGDGRVRPA